MSKKPTNAKFRSERKNELLKLSEILNRSHVCIDIGPINKAAGECSGAYGILDSEWGYDLDNLIFPLRTPRDTRPISIGKNLNLRLSLNFRALCQPDSNSLFEKLELNIEIYDQAPPACKSYISWHFDRHIGASGDGDSAEPHPLYHFQHGGHKTQHHITDEFGKVLLLAAPRLPHPPMDAILAIDFVLANYNGGKWRELRNNPEYTSLVAASQVRFWRPYMELLGSFYDSGGVANSKMDAVYSIWPTLTSNRVKRDRLVV